MSRFHFLAALLRHIWDESELSCSYQACVIFVYITVPCWRECFLNILLKLPLSFLRCCVATSWSSQITPPGIDKACLCSEATGSRGGLHVTGWCSYSAYLPPCRHWVHSSLVISSVLPLISDWVRLLCKHKQDPSFCFFVFFFVKPHPDKWLPNAVFCLPHCACFFFFLIAFYFPVRKVVLQASYVPPERVTNFL